MNDAKLESLASKGDSRFYLDRLLCTSSFLFQALSRYLDVVNSYHILPVLGLKSAISVVNPSWLKQFFFGIDGGALLVVIC
jgi:hypothetical protein